MYHLEDYIDYLKVKGLSIGYIDKRYRDLLKFEKFLNKKHIYNVKKVILKDLIDYVQLLFQKKSILTGKKRSNNYIRSLISTIKNYFKYLIDNNYIIYNPAEKVDLPKKGQYLPRGVMSEAEVLHILSIPDMNTYQGYLYKMIMEILYSTGIRNKELINLEIYDINFEDKTLRVNEGKGRKDRIIPIGKTALKIIQLYLHIERPKVSKHSEEIKLLLNEEGFPLKSEEVCKMIKHYVQKAGIKKHITPHSFRHSFALHLLKHGANIMSIMEMLGHTSLGTTQIYLKLLGRDIKEAHEKHHPREKMKILNGGKSNEKNVIR